jgi:hypothetical protein
MFVIRLAMVVVGIVIPRPLVRLLPATPIKVEVIVVFKLQ